MSRPYRHAVVVLLVALTTIGAAGCAKSYDDHVQDCIEAVRERPDGDTSKPEACEPLKDKDYSLVIMGQVLDDSGVEDSLFPSPPE